MATTNKAKAVKVQIEKFSEEMGILWGFGTVADIVDLEGDIIPQDLMVGAVYQFMQDYYAHAAIVDENHDYKPAETVIVESSLVFIGGNLRWYVGVKLLSDELRTAAKNGEISGFSIGGWAEMEEE